MLYISAQLMTIPCHNVHAQACASVAGREQYASYAGFCSYSTLVHIARECGHPESTVKVTPPTPPPLDTCAGAAGKLRGLSDAPCAREKTEDDTEEKHTPASCGNDECAGLISSIDDDALAKMKDGLKVSQLAPAPMRLGGSKLTIACP